MREDKRNSRQIKKQIKKKVLVHITSPDLINALKHNQTSLLAEVSTINSQNVYVSLNQRTGKAVSSPRNFFIHFPQFCLQMGTAPQKDKCCMLSDWNYTVTRRSDIKYTFLAMDKRSRPNDFTIAVTKKQWSYSQRRCFEYLEEFHA